MAKVAFGGGVSNIQGSIAGNTFTRSKGGTGARNRVKPNNPATPAQMKQREIIARLSRGWRALTDDQRKAWESFGKTSKTKDKCGNVLELTGHQMYVRINSVRERNGDAATAADPPGFGDFEYVVFDVDGTWTMTVTGPTVQVPLTADAAEGDKVEIQATRPKSAGVNAYKGDLKNILNTTLTADDITAGYVDVSTAYVGVYGSLAGTVDKVATFAGRQYDEGVLSNPVIKRVTIAS